MYIQNLIFRFQLISIFGKAKAVFKLNSIIGFLVICAQNFDCLANKSLLCTVSVCTYECVYDVSVTNKLWSHTH